MPTAITIGNFDGVHLAHQHLVARARELATHNGKSNGTVHVLAFDPHPASVLRANAPARLTTWPTRERLLIEAGADHVHRLEPTEALLALDPAAFVETRLLPLKPDHIVEGHDFRFGRKRAGDNGVLAALGQHHRFTVHTIDPVTATLDDHTAPHASSTLTRFLLTHGRARDAAHVLGRPHRVEGEVTQGDRLGRTIGFPTANITPETMPPAEGVYAGTATLPTGATHNAAINVGTRPTVNGTTLRVEAHLLDASTEPGKPNLPGLPEYGFRIALDLTARVRDQVRFESLDHLRAQLDRDMRTVRDRLQTASHTA
ncbi:MAG: riboflavin biosynthesis protein RibF [Planctomycetota bacterium]